MNEPADVLSLAKQVLRVLTQRQPVCFVTSRSLLDDLRRAYEQREGAPILYESLLREVRDTIMEFLAVYAKSGRSNSQPSTPTPGACGTGRPRPRIPPGTTGALPPIYSPWSCGR